MMHASRIVLAVICLAAAGAAIWFFLSGPSPTPILELPPPALIKTAVPVRMNLEATADWIGRAQARHRVTLSALSAGTILSVDANDEALVPKGATLFTLGGPVLEAKLTAAREKTHSLENRRQIAQGVLTRKQGAVKEKIASLDALDAAKTTLQQITAELAGAREQLELLENAAYVKTPISGLFTDRKVTVGQPVSMGDELADIMVPGQVRIVATIFAEVTAHLAGRQINLHAPDGRHISGMITRVMPNRTATGAHVVWIESPAIDKHIQPGQTLSGKVTTTVHENALAVPDRSIVYDQNDVSYVFLKVASGYKQQRVALGLSSGGWVEIVSGIAPDGEVVTEGAYELYYRTFNQSYKVPD